jgi:hypothetical protein
VFAVGQEVGKAKLIANPTRAIGKRLFLVSSPRFLRLLCRLTTGCELLDNSALLGHFVCESAVGAGVSFEG